MENMQPLYEHKECVILVDADYIDNVAFNLIINFETMIGRRIPPADMAKWLVCLALDAGLRGEDNHINVALIHQKQNSAMQNFTPSKYKEELSEKAFKDNLGEFEINAYQIENLVTAEDFYLDALKTICTQKNVKKILLIPNAENNLLFEQIKHTLRDVDEEEKHVTLFVMQPMPGGNFKQEILGYSLMAALGIKASEIK